MVKQQATNNTGLPTSGQQGAGRWYGKDGQPNIVKKGGALKHRFSIFHFLISISNIQFIGLIVAVYFAINLVFATAYYAIGPAAIGIEAASRCSSNDFWNCFFFSAQTLTTVGYGRLSPHTVPANIVSALESLLGLLLFALITGLSYARFSRPKGSILFSSKALFTPHLDGTALMFRIVSARKDTLTDVQANVIAALNSTGPDGITKPQFFTLKLEVEKIQTLVLNWTLVHVINEDSPFFGLNIADLTARQFELLVSIQAYDEYYSNVVKTRSSYNSEDLVDNAKFEIMFAQGDGQSAAELYINKLNDYRML
jgi:inward rectifier potassium channel